MTIARQNRNVLRNGESRPGVEAELRPSAKAEGVASTTPAYSGALRPEAGSTYQMLRVATKECRISRDAASNKLEDVYEI